MSTCSRYTCGVNPARAGMILARALIDAAFEGKPRASGDDPAGYLPAELDDA